MDFTQYILLGAVIAGVVELIKRLRASDWWTVVTIVSAAVVGALFGASGYYPDLDVIEGLVAGLGTSGTIAALAFTRSTPAPTNPV